MAPDAVVDELSSLVEPMVHQELFRRHIFGEDDHDIFINLPVCKMGGAWTPETCGSGGRVGGGTSDPQFDHQGIPQACGLDPAVFGSISLGSSVVIGRHRPVDGDANWVEDMATYVGRTAKVTELFGTDGKGCPVVHVDIDGGDWFWRIRDMSLGSASIPTHCGMTDANVQYGPVQVGSALQLGRHTPWNGDANWAESMAAFVGQTARVTSLEGVDGAGCALVKVDIDGGAWYWRIRDAQISGGGGAAPSAGGFPQHCGMTDETSQYGAATIGARVRLGRHRAVDGDANWASDMEAWVGQTGTVTEHLGADGAGCPVIHVDVDGGSWAWRVRDLMAP